MGSSKRKFSGLVVAIVFAALVAIFLSGRLGETWTDSEISTARLVLSALGENRAATDISNSGVAFSRLSQADATVMVSHYVKALEFAEGVTDPVLDKIHPEFKQHWNGEFEEGLRLQIRLFERGDVPAGLRGSTLADQFTDWWNSNKRDIKIPKR